MKAVSPMRLQQEVLQLVHSPYRLFGPTLTYDRHDCLLFVRPNIWRQEVLEIEPLIVSGTKMVDRVIYFCL